MVTKRDSLWADNGERSPVVAQVIYGVVRTPSLLSLFTAETERVVDR